METNMEGVPNSGHPAEASGPIQTLINACLGWNAVIILVSLVLSIYIFRLQDFGRLGRPVQYFAAITALIPLGIAIYAGLGMYQRKPYGRYASMGLYLVGFVVSLIGTITVWGVWDTFEPLADGLIRTPWLISGFALAYALNWLSARFDETNPVNGALLNAALAVAVLTLILVLWFSGILDGITHVIGVYLNFSPVEDGGVLTIPALQAWLFTIATVVFSVLGWRVLLAADTFGETPFERDAWQGWLMLAPNIFGFAVFFAGPLLLSLYLSFTDSTVGQIPNIVGVDNYIEILSMQVRPIESDIPQDALDVGFVEMFTYGFGGQQYVVGAKDRLFWISLRNTLLFCLFQLPLSTIPALLLAMVLNSKLPGMKLFRAIYFLPSVAAVVGTALIWRWLYTPTIGFFNHFISQAVNAINVIPGIQLTDPQILWLTDPGVVLISMVLLSAWQVVGFNTVLFLAGLQGIPNVLYEAATVDGANRWEQFLNVTLPMLAPTTFFVVITTVIQILQVFNEPFALFPSQPIPENATTSVYYLYRRGFFQFEFGYASSVAWLLFLIIFAITFIQFRAQREGAYE